jgi:hypothetical protein
MPPMKTTIDLSREFPIVDWRYVLDEMSFFPYYADAIAALQHVQAISVCRLRPFARGLTFTRGDRLDVAVRARVRPSERDYAATEFGFVTVVTAGALGLLPGRLEIDFVGARSRPLVATMPARVTLEGPLFGRGLETLLRVRQGDISVKR